MRIRKSIFPDANRPITEYLGDAALLLHGTHERLTMEELHELADEAEAFAKTARDYAERPLEKGRI